MKRNMLLIAAITMAFVAVIFIIFALNHPEISFPWSNAVAYCIYSVYLITMIVLFILSVKKK